MISNRYYQKKEAESQPPKQWTDVFIESPLYIGIVNQVSIANVNFEEYIMDSLSSPFKPTATPGLYQASFIAPGVATLSFQHKVTGKTTYIFHYKIKRLAKDNINEPAFAIGDNYGNKIGLAQLKAQQQINVSAGFTFKSAVVYFSNTGFRNVMVGTAMGPQLKTIDTLLNICQVGSVITFDNVKVVSDGGTEYTIEGRSYTVISDSEVTRLENNSYRAVRKLLNLDFVRGTIYFSGTNFPNVFSISGSEINEKKLAFFARSSVGSIISFENCVYKNDKGALATLSNISIKQE